MGPVNHEERMYTIFVAISGVIIFAFAMGNVTSCLQNAVGARSRFDDRLRQVAEYIHFREVNPMLKRRMLEHFGGACVCVCVWCVCVFVCLCVCVCVCVWCLFCVRVCVFALRHIDTNRSLAAKR